MKGIGEQDTIIEAIFSKSFGNLKAGFKINVIRDGDNFVYLSDVFVDITKALFSSHIDVGIGATSFKSSNCR